MYSPVLVEYPSVEPKQPKQKSFHSTSIFERELFERTSVDQWARVRTGGKTTQLVFFFLYCQPPGQPMYRRIRPIYF